MVKVKPTELKNKISVKASVETNVFSIKDNLSEFYAKQAENWAHSEGMVNGLDYSSKYYAEQSKISAENSQKIGNIIQENYNSFMDLSSSANVELQEVKGEVIDSIGASKQDAIDSIEVSKQDVINEVNSTKTTILNDIEFVADGEKEEIRDIIDTGKDELKETIKDLQVLTTLEIGTISFTQGYIDESKGLRRCLNKVDNIILQDSYPEFTKWLKTSVSLNPSLACTESEWQTELTMSANNFCDKYVIDDEAGTIRLPKYPEYIETNKLDSAKARTVITNYVRGANGYRIWSDGYCEQWGQTSSTKGSSARTVTFSKAFSNANYNLNLQGLSGGSSGNTQFNVFQCTSKTASGFTALAGASENIYMSWRATGYLSGYSPTSSLIATQERLAGTYFIQVATGAETEDNIINEIELNNPFFLGMSQYFETAPNNSSWLKSEGQWNSKAVYPTVYDWALINANNGIEGFKLVTDTYTDYDYVINPADETFRLPLLNGSEDLISDRYENLTLGASGSVYTAPANGWFHIVKAGTNGKSEYINVRYDGDSDSDSEYIYSHNTDKEIYSHLGVALISATKGKKIVIAYTMTGTTYTFRFIYAQGNGSLYFYVGKTVKNANLVNIGRIQETMVTRPMVDGRWIISKKQLILNQQVSSSQDLNFDISDYLPNDGYDYEILISGQAKTGTAVGNSAYLLCSGGTNATPMGGIPLGFAVNQVSGKTQQCASSAIIFVKANDRVVFVRQGDATAPATIVFVNLVAYRRIGTNL